MSTRILGIIAVACTLMAGTALQAAAQQDQPTDIVGRRIQGQIGASGPYFQPTERPFQGSFSRRWQDRLGEVWGDVPAGRGVPPPSEGPVFLPQPRDLIFVHPPRCVPDRRYDSRASSHGLWRRQQRHWGHGWGWSGWCR
ncbi:MAG: hypothetical protein U9R79_12635 [Armatimonadota bacterium]|nr:hypothetical protein [Armatimonadota bacterium]